MSLARRCILRLLQTPITSSYRSGQLANVGVQAVYARQFTMSSCRLCEQEATEKKANRPEGKRGHAIEEISVQESVKYMESEAFKIIYGNDPVWKHYRRNYIGHFRPKPRVTCSRQGVIATGSPCPLCRDDYLVVSYKNRDLLKQFVSDLTGELLDPKLTGVCLNQQKHLKLELARAQDYGYMEKSFHFRKYNYDYYFNLAKQRRMSGVTTEFVMETSDTGTAEKSDLQETVDTSAGKLKRMPKEKISRQNLTAEQIKMKYDIK